MFPKQLPRAAVRRVIQNEKIRRELAIVQPEVAQASLKGIYRTQSIYSYNIHEYTSTRMQIKTPPTACQNACNEYAISAI